MLLPNVLLIPFFAGTSDSVVSRNATTQALANTASKPSFLLWDKVYQKLSSVEDETWLLRALQTTLSFLKSDLMKNEQLRFVSLTCINYMSIFSYFYLIASKSV